MPRRKWSLNMLDDAFGGAAYEVPRFSIGEAVEILEMPIWRLKKFLDLSFYQLRAAKPFGRGKGKRRMFSTEDLYRIAIANFLLKDGFAPKLVVQVLEQIDDKTLKNYDQESDETTLRVYMTRDLITRKRLVLIRPDRSQPPKGTYYVLDFELPMRDVDQGIEDALKKLRRKS